MSHRQALRSDAWALFTWGLMSVVSLLLMSCASLVTDPVVELLIESEPPNATVLYRGSPLGVTPLKVFVPSKTKDEQRRRVFRVEQVGYRSATVNIYSSRNPYTLGNVLFTSTTSGAPSFLTDTYTDYAHIFTDESIVVELKKLPTEEERARGEDSQSSERQREADRKRLDELKRLKQEKEETLKKIKEERAEREALDQERLAAEQARLKAEREARDREALKQAEAKKAQAEAEAQAKREAEAQAKREAEAQKAQEAKAQVEEERGALKAGFDKLVQESSKLAAEREAFEKEKARLQAERARLEVERQSLDELRRSAPEADGRRQLDGQQRGSSATGARKKNTAQTAPRKRDERIDEKEERLLKKLREHQRRMMERSRSKERLMRSPKSLPEFELAPVEESSLLSPSWGALGLTIHSFSRLTRELATLTEAGELDSPTLKALFLRLSLATGSVDELTWERYLLFRHLVVTARPKLLLQPHGLALYRHLKALAHSSQICHSPSLFAGVPLH